MPLTKVESDTFLKLFFSVLAFVNDKFGVLNFKYKPDEIKNLSPTDIGKVRDILYKNLNAIDFFAIENPDNFSIEEIEIIEGWHQYVKKTFYVMSHLKNYSIFLDIIDPPKAYAVYSFDSSFKKILGTALPVMVEMILLPFGDKIVCDSIIDSYDYRPSIELRMILKNAYNDAKMNYGLITSLNNPLIERIPTDKEKLKFYLKNISNREIFKYRIEEIIKKDPKMELFYNMEKNKIHARDVKREAKKRGEKGLWFGIYNGNIISTEITKEEVQKRVNESLPEKLRAFVYIFQV
jgi:hypothetical protein